jgi:signal transduction histidine kinase/ABC-type amino acid transport substrate-binding protein
VGECFGNRDFGLRRSVRVTAVCWALLQGQAFAGAPLRVSVGNSPPLEYRDQQGRPQGFNIDVINEAARRAKITVTWQHSGAIEENDAALRNGTLDLIAGASVLGERRRDFYVSPSWWWGEMVAVVRADSEIRTEPDIAARRIAVTSSGRATVSATYPRGSVTTAPNVREAVAQVCTDAADVALIENIYVRELLPDLAPVCRDLHFRVFDVSARREFHIVARRAVQKEASALRAAIDRMTADGTLALMAARRLPVSTPQATQVAELLRGRHALQLTKIRIVLALLALLGFMAFFLWELRSKRKLHEVNGRLETAQRELESALAQLETAFDRLDDAVLIFSPAGAIRYRNEAAWRMFGGDRQGSEVTVFDLADQSVLTAEQEAEEGQNTTPFRRVLDGWTVHAELYKTGTPPTIRLLECSGALVRDKSGIPILAVTTFRDVTAARHMEMERERLRQQVEHAQKMESLGRLAGGVAHDFNNLLTVIAGNASLLAGDTSLPPSHGKKLSAITSASDTAARLTRQLLDFSRKRSLQAAVVDMNKLVGHTAEILRRTIAETIEIETSVPGEELLILADAAQLQQLIINLAVNARDAMPRGGIFRLEISADVMLEGHGEAAVCLCASDSGSGMSAETMSRVFEPSFTTKPIGTGHGLGLAIVDEITKRWGGTLSVSSCPGQGATFRIVWPRTFSAAASPIAAAAASGDPAD